jgi:large subunit ribosomal protein L31
MNTQLHPNYDVAQVTCSCGNTFETRSTVASIHVENCPNCHPFYTGVQKAATAGGRVERFRARAAKSAVAVA